MPGRLIFAALALVAANLATAAPLQIKIATLAPENSVWMKQMRVGAKEIEQRTDGRVTLKFYGGGVMGNDKKVLRKMRIGQLHGGSFTPSGLTELCPELNLYGMPLVFDSLEEVAYVRERFDQRLMGYLEDAGLVGFGIAGGGFARIMSNLPITTKDDLQGRKVWVPEGDGWTLSAMKAMDLSPVVLPITDVLTGLQTGLIEVIGTPPVAAVALQWYTKLSYLTDFPVVYTYAVLVIDKAVLDKAQPADQVVVREVMDRIYAAFDADSKAENDGAMKALTANDIRVVEPESGAVQQWRGRVLANNLSNAEAGMIPLSLYQDMLATLDEYRSGEGEKTASEIRVD